MESEGYAARHRFDLHLLRGVFEVLQRGLHGTRVS